VVQDTFAHGMKNVAKRCVFVIGKDGIVKYKEITENPGVQVNFEKIKEAVKSLWSIKLNCRNWNRRQSRMKTSDEIFLFNYSIKIGFCIPVGNPISWWK